jgi:hypothetical protein
MSLDEIERHTDGQVIARRNMRLGLWAGMRLGLRGDRLADYAREVMDADYLLPGPEDVVRKIRTDFEASGVEFSVDLIRLELQRLERQVRAELITTD